jgi:putative spermidine/putrescine transport system permease protein
MIDRDAAWTVRLLAWVLIALLVLPFLVVIPVSLTDRSYLAFPRHGLSIAHYREMLSDPDWRIAFSHSVIIACATTAIATSIGAACAFGCWRLPPRAATFVRAIILLPLIVPTIIQALAFYRTWVTLHLLDSYSGVILAHTIIAVPFVFIAVSAALVQVDPRIEMAARSLGARTDQTLLWVIAPMVLPGVLSGAVFAFIASFDELIIVLFITNYDISTLPKKMWDGLNNDLNPTIACVAVALGMITVGVLALEWLLTKRRTTASIPSKASPASVAAIEAKHVASSPSRP